jgi:aspartate carbamoyltransferase catalytic subunit
MNDLDTLINTRLVAFPKRHFHSAIDLDPPDVLNLLDLADAFVLLNASSHKKLDLLKGKTLIHLFFENSTRTQASFELAALRLGADTVTMNPRTSSLAKGETLIDTAMTLKSMRPDLLVIRHPASGAAQLLSQKMQNCAVINAGDGSHQHPTQGLLDLMTIRRTFGHIDSLKVAICGDIIHSRVARSNAQFLNMMGAEVRLVGPITLLPSSGDDWGGEIYTDMREGISGCDIVMMLRLQKERMEGSLIPSAREFTRYYGLDREKLKWAAPRARVMHPGPMNRGVEIESDIADDPKISLIQDQVEMGVALRMAVLASLSSRMEERS